MAKNRAELETDAVRYREQLQLSQIAESEADFFGAVSAARDAWPHADGMMQYSKRWGDKVVDRVEAIDVVLRLAPSLFDWQSLDTLADLLKSQRRIDKACGGIYSSGLTAARDDLRNAVQVWNSMQQTPGVPETAILGRTAKDRGAARTVIQLWCAMGAARRVLNGTTDCLWICDLTNSVLAACSNCGAKVKAPKVKLLDQRQCPSCRKPSWFVFLSEIAASA